MHENSNRSTRTVNRHVFGNSYVFFFFIYIFCPHIHVTSQADLAIWHIKEGGIPTRPHIHSHLDCVSPSLGQRHRVVSPIECQGEHPPARLDIFTRDLIDLLEIKIELAYYYMVTTP